MDPQGYTSHEFGDAMIAVGGGDDHAVQVISVSDGRVVRLLKVGPDRYECTLEIMFRTNPGTWKPGVFWERTYAEIARN